MTKLSEEMQEKIDSLRTYSYSGVDLSVAASLEEILPRVKALEKENDTLADRIDDMRGEMAEAVDMADWSGDRD